MTRDRHCLPLIVFIVSATALLVLTDHSQAAGTAYAVDTAEVSSPGSCKIESWLSWASNRDVIAAVSPACVVDFGRPVEVSAQIARARADGEWTSGITPKMKTNLFPVGIGTFGLALSSTASFDPRTAENTSVAVTVPATMRMSENTRINLNAGWLWDRGADRHYLTYGVGLDLRTPDNVWIFTAEVFGQVGEADVSSVVQPRFQAGLRYRPGGDRFSVDLIYGRNITGENANWITVATTMRFPVADK